MRVRCGQRLLWGVHVLNIIIVSKGLAGLEDELQPWNLNLRCHCRAVDSTARPTVGL
jgi:hypothetical protein